MIFYELVTVLAYAHYASCFILPDDGYRHVHTKVGEIVGHVEFVNFDGRNLPVTRFLGIPYAAPPVGDLRFQKPVPTKLPSSPYAAHTYGNVCIQDAFGQSPGVKSEDCLFLNVFAPSDAGQPGVSPKPVMVWIYGGGFIFGDSNTYEADILSGYSDVIVVTMNYRLGPIGFFSTHDDYAPGNYGVWDQHAAIKWVKDNINAFGGDNNNMTIFGESAGGASVFFQMMYPGNKGLFTQAIIESGSLAFWALTPKEHSLNSSLAFAAALGCDNATRADMFRCIRTKPSSAVVQAADAVKQITMDFNHPAWVPVYDGDFVISDPARFLEDAAGADTASKYPAFKDTNLLLGANSYDGSALTSLLFHNPNIFQNITQTEFENKDVPILLDVVTKRTPSKTTINAVIQEYEIATGQNNVLDSLIRAVTDAVFKVPAAKTARSHAASSSYGTFLYEFAATVPNRPYPLPPYLQNDPRGANHADELLYLFGYADSLAQDVFNISSPASGRDLKMSKFVMTAWTNFAKSGDPNRPVDLGTTFNVSWPSYTPQGLAYLDISHDMAADAVKHNFSQRALQFWSQPDVSI